MVGFNQTSTVFVNETSKYLSLPIVRYGDLSKPFSVMCYTRGQTASEGKDFVPRGSFEHSRVFFESGDKVTVVFTGHFLCIYYYNGLFLIVFVVVEILR